MAEYPWIDRVLLPFAPQWVARRTQARIATGLMQRHFEAAATGRRTEGWTRFAGDANAANRPALDKLRNQARDLVRNNPYAYSAVATLADHVVGYAITAKPAPKSAPPALRARAQELWDAWANTTACDADGRHDFAGLQKLVMRTIVESGECLVRRRVRLPSDGLPIPLQLQVLEPDFLDTTKDGVIFPNNAGRQIQGVEFNALGRRSRYWLLREHPGASGPGLTRESNPIPADYVLHVFNGTRPGQVRGVSWFAPVMLRLKDFDEYEDAALVKQKIAACLAVLTTDINGTGAAIGEVGPGTPQLDMLEPGVIMNVPPGRSVSVVQPPTVSEHGDYCAVTLRAIATGLGLSYEDLTGSYEGMPFSAARMSRLRHWARVNDWRWRMLIPQFCDPVWRWAMEAASVAPGLAAMPAAEWTAPPAPMIEPDREGLAYQRLIRTGLMTLSEAIRERGYDPQELLEEMAADNARLDALGLRLDSDARMTSQQGFPVATQMPPAVAPEPSADGAGAPAPAGGANGTNGRNGTAGPEPDGHGRPWLRASTMV